MQDNFVNYEIALELKELGFDQPCLATFFELKSPDEGIFTLGNDGSLLCPLFQQVQKWLRDKHNIHIVVNVNHSGWFWLMDKADNGTFIQDFGLNGNDDSGHYDTYESALESGIKAALTYIKQNNNDNKRNG